jgi:hypothetical protein
MKILITVFVVFVSFSPAYAKWNASGEILSGSWGDGIGEFGFIHADPVDGLPEEFLVDIDGNIIISDQMNKRIQVFQNGLISVVYPLDLKISWEPDVWPSEKSVAIYAGHIFETEYNPVQIYNYKGELVSIFNVGSKYFKGRDLKGSLFFLGEDEKYSQYSPTGELLATYGEKPLELGVERSHRSLPGDNYLQVIEFEDVKFNIVTPGGIESFVRDQAGFFYGVESVDGTKAEWRYRVHKFDQCSRKIGYLDLPEDDIRTEEYGVGDGPTTFVTVLEQYGPPVIGPDGSVYAWKRTPETYSILKWQWVDEPSDPKPGPDAPTNLELIPSMDGLYLTWDSSAQDPGCVTGYQVDRASSADGIYTSIGSVEAGSDAFNDTGALPGSSYFYKVKAVADGLSSEFTSAVSGAR